MKKLQLSLMDGVSQTDSISQIPLSLQGYDVLVLDEAQDCTDAMLDIFKRVSGVAKVVAYDVHQNISQFRGVTSFGKLVGMCPEHSRNLLQSLRFGPVVAKLLTDFIRYHKPNLMNFEVKGDPSKQTVVKHVASIEEAYEKALGPLPEAHLEGAVEELAHGHCGPRWWAQPRASPQGAALGAGPVPRVAGLHPLPGSEIHGADRWAHQGRR